MTPENQIKSEVYRFNECILDADRRELRVRGETVTMQPKAFELLLFLVRNRHRAIDKDELQDTLWPRSIVTETALTRCVMKARRAVDDDADRQGVIRTVHGHGYRFVASLDEGAEAAPATDAAGVDVVPSAPRGRRPGLLGATAAAALVLAALVWLFSPPALTGDIRLAVLPLENATGEEDLDWTRLGLMALMNRMLEERGVQTVSENTVADLAGSRPVEELVARDSEFQKALRQTTAATHVIGATLSSDSGLYRLTYTLSGDGRPETRTVVGQEPAGLIRDVVTTVATLVTDGPPELEHMSFVSSDDFMNAAYARAMSLQFEGRYAEAQRIFSVMIEQEPELFWPRYEFALAARNLRDFETAERLLVELREEFTGRNEPAHVAAVQNTLGILFMNRRRNDEARAAFEDVLAHADAAGDFRYAAIANINLGLLAKNTGDLQGAYDHMQTARAIYEQADVQSLPGTLLNNLSGVLIQMGRLDEAEEQSLAAIENFRLTGKRLYESYALSRLASIHRRNGLLDEALETAELALAVREELDDRHGIGASLVTLASIAADRGDLTRSLQYARQAHDISVEIDDDPLDVEALLYVGKAELLLGDADAAARSYGAAEALARSIDDATNVFAARYGIGRARLAAGDHDGASAIAAELLETARMRDHPRDETAGLILRADVSMALEQWAAAVEPLEEALGIAESVGDHGVAGDVHVRLARAWLGQGRVEEASTHIAAAGKQRPDNADVLRLRSRVAALGGDTESAIRLLTEARSRAGEAWTDDDEEQLARLRAPAPAETASAD